MSRVDATLLVIAGSVAGELENFCRQILEHGRKIYYKGPTNQKNAHMERGRERPGAPEPIRRPREDFLSMRWIRLTGN
jgi:hypothetical protein